MTSNTDLLDANSQAGFTPELTADGSILFEMRGSPAVARCGHDVVRITSGSLSATLDLSGPDDALLAAALAKLYASGWTGPTPKYQPL